MGVKNYDTDEDGSVDRGDHGIIYTDNNGQPHTFVPGEGVGTNGDRNNGYYCNNINFNQFNNINTDTCISLCTRQHAMIWYFQKNN